MLAGDTNPGKARPIWQAAKRGAICRCPNCGKGKLFDGFLEQVGKCAECGEPLAQFNAGLLLPLIVGLLIVFLFAGIFLVIELNGGASPGMYLALLLPTSTIASLLVIRPCKGAVVGFMWAVQTSDELAPVIRR